jgi:hypothetical protein
MGNPNPQDVMASFSVAGWPVVFLGVALSSASAAPGPNQFHVEAYHHFEMGSPVARFRLVTAGARGSTTFENLEAATAQLRAALRHAGFAEAPEGNEAAIEIAVDFFVQERVESRSRFSQRFRPVTHRITTINLPANAAVETDTPGKLSIALPVDDGFISWRSQPQLVTYYEKRLVIAAREIAPAAPARKARELWRVEVTGKDETADAKTDAASMVTAAVGMVTAPWRN